MLLDQIDPVDLGERLRLAREKCNLRQADAAERIGIARTTLVAIESGKRKLKIFELKKLSALYKISLNSLLRKEAVHVDLIPRFRRHITSHENIGEKAANILTKIAKAEVELENILGTQRAKNYPPERPLLSGNVIYQAEQDAIELRRWLGLGLNSPIHDIMSILELDMGVRVYIKKLDSKISGLFIYEESLGACIMLNANHPKDRRKQSAAHEIGHLVATRRMPEVLYEDDPQTSREERYANAFARCFLMPARAMAAKFQEVRAGANQFTRRHVILLSNIFGTSREAVVYRLEELELVPKGTWDWFKMNGGITDKQAQEVLGDLYINNRDQQISEKPTNYRLNSLICQTWQQGLLSEGQLTDLLDISYKELREILDHQEIDGSKWEDAPMLLN